MRFSVLISFSYRSGLLLLGLLLLLLGPVRGQNTRPILRLDVLNNGALTDQAYVYFQNGATAGFDPLYDAAKLANPSGLNVASFAGTQQMAINGLPPLVPGTPLAVPLFVGVPAFGTYRLRVGQFDNFLTTSVYLRDNSLNTRTLLALNTLYSFSMSGTFSTSTRFVLEFEEPLLTDLVVSTNIPIPAAAYRNITITTTGQLTLDKNVTVTGTLTIQPGGIFITGTGSPADPDGYVLSGNSFVMEPASRLVILSRHGISASGPRGNIQTTTRTFSSDALYTYASFPPTASVVCVTGDGLPARVRTLGAAVYLQPNSAPGTLTLSQPQVVTRLLDLVTNLNTDGHALTLASTPTGPTAQVSRSSGTLTGTLTMERAIDPTLNSGAGYRHFANPLLGSATQQFTTTTGQVPVSNPAYNASATPNTVAPFPTMFGYDATAIAGSPALGYSPFDRGWRALDNGDPAPGRGRGFIVHLDAGQVARFEGTLSHASQVLTLPARTTAHDGWSLLGNPFASLLNWNDVPVPAGLENAFYVFETTGPYAGRYRSYVNGMGPSPVIPTGQGFFVRTRYGTAPVTLTLPEAARFVSFDASVPTLHRNTTDTRPQVKLRLSGRGSTDELYLYAQAGATAAFDAAFDAHKLPSAGQVELAALAGSEALSIAGLPPFSATQPTVVPLRVAVPQPGSYTLAAEALTNLPALPVYLLDAYTGQRIDLRQQPRYTFTATPAALAGRFALQIGAAGPLAITPAALDAALSLYPNPAHETLTVRLPPVAGAPAIEATLLDNLGRTVLHQQVAATPAGTAFSLPTAGLAPGIYTLRLRLAAAVVTRRVVVE